MTMKYILPFSLALCTLASCQSNDAMEETLHSAKEVVRNNVFRLKPLKHSAKTPQINQDAAEAEDQVSSVVIAGKAAARATIPLLQILVKLTLQKSQLLPTNTPLRNIKQLTISVDTMVMMQRKSFPW